MRFARFFSSSSLVGRVCGASAVGAGLFSVSSMLLEPDLASFIDHTLLAANATPDKLAKLCEEAARHHFRTVCVNASNVRFCAERLRDSGVLVCAVVGFPLGATLSSVKVKKKNQEKKTKQKNSKKENFFFWHFLGF